METSWAFVWRALLNKNNWERMILGGLYHKVWSSSLNTSIIATLKKKKKKDRAEEKHIASDFNHFSQ